jgi:predicted DCC family thiol-disulfide oxidoreductase YuxK
LQAFRKFYEAVNLGWVYAVTKNKAVLKVANAVYDVWAKYRMQVTGRPPIEQVVQEKKKRQVRGGPSSKSSWGELHTFSGFWFFSERLC